MLVGHGNALAGGELGAQKLTHGVLHFVIARITDLGRKAYHGRLGYLAKRTELCGSHKGSFFIVV